MLFLLLDKFDDILRATAQRLIHTLFAYNRHRISTKGNVKWDIQKRRYQYMFIYIVLKETDRSDANDDADYNHNKETHIYLQTFIYVYIYTQQIKSEGVLGNIFKKNQIV